MKIPRRTLLAAILALAACHTDQATQASRQSAELRLRFGQAPFALTMGAGMRLAVQLVNTAGDTTAAPASMTIVSRDPAVIRIDSGTKLQSTGPGSAWVVARLDTAGKTLVDSLKVDVVCTLELVKVLKPAAETLAVGQSFTPSASAVSCGGYVTEVDTMRWSASDATIIRVDSLTGLTTGLSAGQTVLTGVGKRFGTFGGIPVTVRAP